MNGEERRAQRPPSPQAAAAAPLLVEASRHQQQGKFDQAATLYKRALAVNPDDAQALNNLAVALLALGKREEAAARFARALALVPELLEHYPAVCATLQSVNPAIGEAMARAAAAWPALLPAKDLLAPGGVAGVARDPLLRGMLEGSSVRDVNLERVLTAVRAELLERATDSISDRIDADVLAFSCALARQCFINEYVFAVSPAELQQAECLRQSLLDDLASGRATSPMGLASLASYCPLGSLPNSDILLAQPWPEPVADVLTQQVREPREEQDCRATIARLTPIEDAVSRSVMQQYEENPYPRWINPPSRRPPVTVDDYLRTQFPAAAVHPLGKRDNIDALLAGCGTGGHSIAIVQRFEGVRLLAVDLSLASLAYALRKTRAAGLSNIEYGQADILQLASLGRTFDLIDAGGVLHHLADPLEGWRVLVSLLRPGGVMRIGLYSALGRRDVAAARAFIAAQGYRPTADDIRRCRQELLRGPHSGVSRYYDFFSTSECRDLLFHVQEHRLDLPTIGSFLAEYGLVFIGFECSPHLLAAYKQRFPADAAMTDIAQWHAFETTHPDTFAGMYQFWIQKN